MSDTSAVESIQRFYDAVARRDPRPFVNYGYADSVLPTNDSAIAELATVCRRLYEVVLMPFPDADRVVEIGCGRGGGAAFLLEAVPHLKYLGLDLSAEHVRVCRGRFNSGTFNRTASFAQADATKLPVGDARLDAAFSIEAVHHFQPQERFYHEVARALRAGGWFLLAGLWRPAEDPRRSFADYGFRLIERVDITGNVVTSLARTSDQRKRLIESLDLPERFRPLLLSWAGVVGHGAYESLASRSLVYVRYRLQRT